ncbi:MAG TPA: DNA-binding protein, partial [Bradyrhizobium sp.]
DFPIEAPTVLPSIVKAHLSDLGYSLAELTKLVRIRESEFVEMYGAVTGTPKPTPKLQIIR